MRRIRYLLLAALGVFVALPVARVYTSGAPWIERIELRNNDLNALRGKGVPGTVIEVKIRQRNFRQGSPGGMNGFQWCAWLFNGLPLNLGTTQVTPAGTWQLTGLDWQVLPGEAAGRTCATGVLSQIELHSQYGDVSTPNVTNLNMAVGGDPTHQRVGGAIQLANQVAIGLADGPNEVQDGAAPGQPDTDEDGVDLCEVGIGCGAGVTWSLTGGGTFLPPSIEVRDDSPLFGPRDQEFGHVMGMIQGHKPGGSTLAVAYIPRPAPLGPALNVNVNIKADIDVGVGCDSSSFHFDFLPL